MGEQIATSRAGIAHPLGDLNFAMDIQKLQNEFTRALRSYQDCMQKLKLDPQNSEYQQNVAESQKQIVAIDLKQKLFVKQFREKSHMTPAVLSSENNKVGGGKEKKEENGLKNGERNSNETVVVVNGSNHYTPPNSEDEHSDVSRSVSTMGSCGVSICTDSISCPSSVSNTPLSSRPSSPVINSKSSNSALPVFPSDVMEQEEFLKGFGLITHESLKSQSETKRVERRRRTTANPKYNTNGFVDLSQISRRTRRLEETGEAVVVSSPKRMTLIASVKSKHSEPKCIVCEQPGCNLTCESCEGQLHVDCIRVSGSKAPAPTRLHHCPRCIVALNESQRFAPSPSSSSSSSSSNDDYVKFQKPLIPTTPIIPANLKKKPLPSSSTGDDNEDDSSSESKTVTSSSGTKPKLMKKIGLSVAQKSAATTMGTASAKANKKVSKNKKAGLKVSSSSSVIHSSDSTSSKLSTKLDHLGKPLASPFKSLAALTAKGAAAAANVKNIDGISNCNGDSNSVNGNHTNIIPHVVKKKSKLNGVKAKTLSVTGGNTNSPTSKLTKPKASPLNNINSNGNIGSRPNKPLVKTSTNRLPKNADQHLSMEKTILAMTAAAKSVMSGMKVQPVSRGSNNLDFHNNYHEKEQSAKATNAILGNNNNCSSSSSSSSSNSSSSNRGSSPTSNLVVASPPTLSYHPPSSPSANNNITTSSPTTTTTIPESSLSSRVVGNNSELNITNNCNNNLILEKQ